MMAAYRNRGQFIEALESRRLLAVHSFADVSALAPAGVDPANMYQFGNKVVFAGNADGSQNDQALFISDGTAGGTKQISESSLSAPIPLFTTSHSIYFIGYGENGLERGLYKTDGTSKSATLVIAAEDSDKGISRFYYFVASGENVYFVDYIAFLGGEKAVLYRDGPKGLSVVRRSGSDFGLPRNLTTVGSTLYMAVDTAAGPQLWKSNGTSAGTVPIKFHASVITQFAVYNNELYFAAKTTTQQGLWKLKDGSKPTFLKPAYSLVVFFQLPNTLALWFTIADSQDAPQQLWRLNAKGMHQMTSFLPGQGITRDSRLETSDKGILVVANLSDVWWCGVADGGAVKLASFPDPTPKNGAQLITAMFSDDASIFVKVQDKKAANFWRYNMATKTETLISPIALDTEVNLAGHTAVFRAPDATNEYELWGINDSAAKPSQITEITGGDAYTDVDQLTPINGGLMFTTLNFGNDDSYEQSFWFTDGIKPPKLLVQLKRNQFNFNSLLPTTKIFATSNGYALFSMYDSINNNEQYAYGLWRIDPSTGTTTQLGKGFSEITFLGQIGSKTVFATFEGIATAPNLAPDTPIIRVWITDGTPSGTKPLNRFFLDDYDSTMSGVTFDGKVYFIAAHQFYMTDGTPGGTVSAQSILSAPSQYINARMNAMTIRDGKLLLMGEMYSSSRDQYVSGVWSKPTGATKAILLTQEVDVQFLSAPGSGKIFIADQYSIPRYVVPASPTPLPQEVVFDVNGNSSPDYIGYASGHYYVVSYDSDANANQIYALDKNFSNAQPVGPSGVFGDAKNAVTIGNSLIFVDTNFGKIYSISGTTETEIGDIGLASNSSDPRTPEQFTQIGQKLFFVPEDPNDGRLLYYTKETSVTGKVFADTNGNGVLDTGEKGLAGWQVFVDLNGDGIDDPGDYSATTNSSGSFELDDVITGNWAVQITVQAGHKETTATPFYADFTQGSVVHKNFGVK